jgi:SAM-dependent methyltransferase
MGSEYIRAGMVKALSRRAAVLASGLPGLSGRGRIGKRAALRYDDPAEFVERAYLVVLGRTADEQGKARYVAGLEAGRLSARGVIEALAASAEFARRFDRPAPPSPPANGAGDASRGEGYLDPKTVIETEGIDRLLATAEGYFSSVEDPEPLYAKPFWSIDEAPEILVSFGHLLGGLRPLPGQVILDFGAGACWTSRALAQLGAEVIALDASESALVLGAELFRRYPPAGHRPAPRFLVFDGRKIDLPDESVDAVSCFDAFHHVPNPEEILAEFYRVLRPGGTAGFSEVGEHHSHSAVAQREMRLYGVLENDIVLSELAPKMEEIGFVDLRVNVFSTASYLVPRPAFDAFLAGAATAPYVEMTRRVLEDRRMFFVRKPGAVVLDSRQSVGLDGEVSVAGAKVRTEGANRWIVSGVLTAHNTGSARWLPSSATVGAVMVGIRAPGARHVDVGRVDLGAPEGVDPGESREVAFQLELGEAALAGCEPPALLEVALVSEKVAWFGTADARTCRIALED